MRVAYISLATPNKLASWSGMPWYTWREVQRRFDDVHLLDSPWVDTVVERLSSLQRYGLSIRQRGALMHYHARIIAKQLKEIRPDVVLSIGASHKIINVEFDCPLIHVSDGLFGTMAGYYDKFRRFDHEVLRDAHAAHQKLANKASLLLFASDWARESALELYDVPASKTQVLPFGANMDEEPAPRPRTGEGPLKLFFLGYDWERKGGETVLSAWRLLRRELPDAELHIAGCSPAEALGLSGVHVYGRLNKARAHDRDLLADLFEQASLFFMPSRQEAFGMVFCEAAAYGLPSIATHTGGVPTAVGNGETGVLLPSDAAPSAYAYAIADLWNDRPRYLAMTRAARVAFEQRLNWRAWGAGVETAIDAVLR